MTLWAYIPEVPNELLIGKVVTKFCHAINECLWNRWHGSDLPGGNQLNEAHPS